MGGEKYTAAANSITEVVELILNRKVELPQEAKKQWKSRNLPVIRGMEVKVVAFQELEMLVFQVTLSIPQPDVEVLAVAAAGGEGKLIDFASFNEVQWKEEEEEIRKMKSTSVQERPKMPPIQLTMKYQLTDSELLVFGTTEKVDNKTVSPPDSTSNTPLAHSPIHPPSHSIKHPHTITPQVILSSSTTLSPSDSYYHPPTHPLTHPPPHPHPHPPPPFSGGQQDSQAGGRLHCRAPRHVCVEHHIQITRDVQGN